MKRELLLEENFLRFMINGDDRVTKRILLYHDIKDKSFLRPIYNFIHDQVLQSIAKDFNNWYWSGNNAEQSKFAIITKAIVMYNRRLIKYLHDNFKYESTGMGCGDFQMYIADLDLHILIENQYLSYLRREIISVKKSIKWLS